MNNKDLRLTKSTTLKHFLEYEDAIGDLYANGLLEEEEIKIYLKLKRIIKNLEHF